MRRRNIFLQWASCPILRFAPNVLPETAVPSARLEQDPHAVEAPLGGRVVQRVGRGEHGGGRIGSVAVVVVADPLSDVALPAAATAMVVIVVVLVVVDGRRQAGKRKTPML